MSTSLEINFVVCDNVCMGFVPFTRAIKVKILSCFWMGFLLFLPAYRQSPGGIMMFGPVAINTIN